MASGYSRHKYLAVIIIIFSFTVGSLSVTGLLQSTEKFSSSGVIVVPPPSPPIVGGGTPSSPPPPEPTVEIDVYSDQACTQTLTDVIWGEIETGESSSETIHVKNNGDTNVFLSLDTENWSPENATDYMNLYWNYDGTSIPPGQVRSIVLTLSISGSCPAMSEFNFDILIIGS